MMISWLKGLWLLRKPELVRALGDIHLLVRELDKVRRAMPTAIIHPDVLIEGWSGTNLQLGNNVQIAKGSMLVLGDRLAGYGDLTIGDNTWIGQYNNFRLSAGANISV